MQITINGLSSSRAEGATLILKDAVGNEIRITMSDLTANTCAAEISRFLDFEAQVQNERRNLGRNQAPHYGPNSSRGRPVSIAESIYEP